MLKRSELICPLILCLPGCLVAPGVLLAQDEAPAVEAEEAAEEAVAEVDPDPIAFDEVVVTANVNRDSKLESSISVSTLSPEAVERAAPRSTAEVFRNIPGVRSSGDSRSTAPGGSRSRS